MLLWDDVKIARRCNVNFAMFDCPRPITEKWNRKIEINCESTGTIFYLVP